MNRNFIRVMHAVLSFTGAYELPKPPLDQPQLNLLQKMINKYDRK